MLMAARLRGIATMGPAFVAAVAYVDPGNVATNVTAGSRYGYTLVWVVALASAKAVIVQYLAAKLGLVTGRSLAAHLGNGVKRPIRILYWLQAEAVAITTDLAEVVGGAVALRLLFGTPLVVGAITTAAVSFALLRFGDRRGPAVFERITMCLLALIAVGFTSGLFVDPPSARGITEGMIPAFTGSGSMNRPESDGGSHSWEG